MPEADINGTPQPQPARKPRLGGRSARVRAAVLDATLSLLRERGDAFSIGDIAERSGVHESSIYRRWGTREALIVEAVRSHVGIEVPIPDTGTLAGDVLAFLDHSIAFLNSPLGRQLVRATAAVSPATGDVRSSYWPERLARIGVIFDRAVERGEIAPGVDVGLAAELLLAPLYFRLLVTQAPLDDELASQITQTVLASLCAGQTGR